MRLFGTVVFVVDGPVMTVFALGACGSGGLVTLLQTDFDGTDGLVMNVFALLHTGDGLVRLSLHCLLDF